MVLQIIWRRHILLNENNISSNKLKVKETWLVYLKFCFLLKSHYKK